MCVHTGAPEACERVTGHKPDGVASNGFIHLINSGATALDGSGACVDENGNHVMKPFWEMKEEDIKNCLEATDWCRADYEYFRGGGYSSHFRCHAEMPVTMLRFNIIDGVGPVLQIAEGWTADRLERFTIRLISVPIRHGLLHGSARDLQVRAHLPMFTA